MFWYAQIEIIMFDSIQSHYPFCFFLMIWLQGMCHWEPPSLGTLEIIQLSRLDNGGSGVLRSWTFTVQEFNKAPERDVTVKGSSFSKTYTVRLSDCIYTHVSCHIYIPLRIIYMSNIHICNPMVPYSPRAFEVKKMGFGSIPQPKIGHGGPSDNPR